MDISVCELVYIHIFQYRSAHREIVPVHLVLYSRQSAGNNNFLRVLILFEVVMRLALGKRKYGPCWYSVFRQLIFHS